MDERGGTRTVNGVSRPKDFADELCINRYQVSICSRS